MSGTPTAQRDAGNGAHTHDPLWEAISNVQGDLNKVLDAIGKLSSDIKADQGERRSFTWLRPYVRLATLALVAHAAAYVWSVWHGGG